MATPINQQYDDIPSGFTSDTASNQEQYADIPPGFSSITSEPVTPMEEAQQRLNEFIDRTPVKEKRSLLPEAGMATAGAAALEFGAGRLSQQLPPNLRYLGTPLKILGGLAGAFGGGMSGRGIQQVATGKVGEGFFGEQVESGLTQLKDEAIGQVGGGLLGRVLSGGIWKPKNVRARQLPGMEAMSQKLTEAGKRSTKEGLGQEVSEQTLKSLQKGRAGLTEGQKGRSVITSLESFTRGTIGGGELNDILKDLNPAALKQLQNELVEQYWKEAGVQGKMSPDAIALEITEAINKNMDNFHQRFATKLLNGKKPLDSQVVGNIVQASREAVVKHNRKEVGSAYTAVEDLVIQAAERAGVPIKDINKRNLVSLDETIAQAQKGFKEWAERPRDTDLRTEMMAMYESVIDGPGKTTIQDADKDLRGALLAKARKLETTGTRSIDPVKSKAIGELAEAAKVDLKRSLDTLDPAINDALLRARSRHLENVKLEDHPFVKKIHTLLDSSQPENLVKHIFKDGSPSGIELAQRSLGKETVAELGDTWLNKQVTESLGNNQSIGIELKNRLNKLGRPSLEKVFGKEKTNDLFAVASSFKKEGASFLENRAIKGALNLVDTNPSLIAHRVIQKNNTPLMLKWKKQLGPARFKKVQAAWVDDVITAGTFNKSLHDLGPKMMKNTFPDPKHLQHLKDVGRLEEILGKASDGHSILAKILQASVFTAGLKFAPGQG